MRTIYFLLICFGFFSQHLLAQTFHGRVISIEAEPLAYATILLHQASDSTIVKVGYSDEDGHFSIPPQKDVPHFLEISYLNMKTYFSGEISLSQNTELGKITLSPDNQLDEVVVKGQQSIIQLKDGKTIMNVDKSITAVGQSALEVLKMAPGISVGINGQINMYGKSNAIIYINGKRTQLGLQSIPADQIKSIEIIDNPSAKYDAQGNAGVINILLKRAKDAGWKGMIIGGTSYKTQFRNQLTTMASHHQNKLSFSTTLTFQNGIWPQKNTLIRTTSSNVFLSDANIAQHINALKYNAGLDYAISNKSTVGILWQGLYAKSLFDIKNTTKIFENPKEETQQFLVSDNKTSTQKIFNTVNLNYTYKVNPKTQLNFDANYGLFDQAESIEQPNEYFDSNHSSLAKVDFFIDQPSQIKTTSFNMDLATSIGKGKLDIGLKTTRLISDNTFDFYNFLAGVKKIDSFKTNTFQYTENVHAAYFDYGHPINSSIRVSLGLRAELMDINAELTALFPHLNIENTNNRIDWFPAVSIRWQANPKTNYALTFSNRVNRPNYYKLNPFEIKLDELNGQKGNPFLKPEYAHSLDLTVTHNRKLQVKFSYSLIDQVIARLETPEVNNRSFLTWANLDYENIWNTNISYPIAFSKHVVFQTNTNIFHRSNTGQLADGTTVNLSATGFDAKIQSRISLPKHFAIELMAMYQSPTIWESTFNLDQYWRMDLGIRKAILKGRAVIKLVAADLFFSQKLQMTSNISGQKIDGIATSESQQLRLFFQYQFGNSGARSTRRRTTGLESVKKRTGKE